MTTILLVLAAIVLGPFLLIWAIGFAWWFVTSPTMNGVAGATMLLAGYFAFRGTTPGTVLMVLGGVLSFVGQIRSDDVPARVTTSEAPHP